MKKDIDKSLDGVYDFMAQAYHGNWQYRWAGTPHMRRSLATGRKDSILGHQWACVGFWFYLSRICPHLSALVDKAEIYERLWSHDLGETFSGDVSQFAQLSGAGKGKHAMEKKEIEKMGKKIPKGILHEITGWFDETESTGERKYENISKIEALVVKFIDNIQGDHFALVFGNDLKKNSPVIEKIMGRTFFPVAGRLLQVLKAGGHSEAYAEVQAIATYHLAVARKAGIKINLKISS